VRLLTLYVKPFKLDVVVEALAPFAKGGIAVEEVRGYGRQKGHLELYSGSEYQITFLPKVKLELLCAAARERGALEAARAAARTGRIGDGKVLVREVRSHERLGGGAI